MSKITTRTTNGPETSGQVISPVKYRSYEVVTNGRIKWLRDACYEPRGAAFANPTREVVMLTEYFEVEQLNETILSTLAQIYAEIFEAEPWLERGRCWTCGNFYPQRGDPCPNDGTIVGEAYPLEWTMRYISDEITKPQVLLITTSNPGTKELYGFAWGYEITIKEFAEEKYTQDPEMTERVLQLLLTQIDQGNPTSTIFLISEVGTVPQYRGKGIAFQSCALLLEWAKSQELPVVTRTIVDPPSVYGVASKLGMTQISGPIRDTTDLKIEPTDTINPRRVLFIRR